MADTELAQPELAGRVKQKYAPANVVQRGRAIQIDIEPPTYDTLNGQPVVAHFECRRFEHHDEVMRYVGDIVRLDRGELYVAELLREQH